MKCPDCNAELVGVEYMDGSERYDGVSEWACLGCTYRRGRWSGRRLEGNELESRFGLTPKGAATRNETLI